jgi:NRAMP (natural resistance-associated macrophage protein)-like metal ion transporter
MLKSLTKLRRFWRQLGPGLITGAADDDPSGIITYAIAGAKMGLAALWTALATLPFMIITQRMAGRIGLISGRGLAGNMKKHYPRWILFIIAFLILGANIINIGADISAMSASIALLAPQISPIIFSAVIPLTIIALLIFLPYRKMANYLKWIAIVMFSYVLAAFFVELDWLQILHRAFIPKIIASKDYLLIVIAVFGTTISPYLFFWQASGAVEEEILHEQARNHSGKGTMIPATGPHIKHRSPYIIKNEISSMYRDVRVGMSFSNLITFFIITLCAFTLFKAGHFEINTVEEVASALKPMAGPYSNFLFLLGILASGTLAIPVLAGSAAYAMAEMFGWRWGFTNTFHKAKQFYLIIVIATLLGIAIPAFNLHPVQILFLTAIIYGFISPLLILLLIHMANNPKIMGKYTSRLHSNIIAYLLFLILTGSIILMLAL